MGLDGETSPASWPPSSPVSCMTSKRSRSSRPNTPAPHTDEADPAGSPRTARPPANVGNGRFVLGRRQGAGSNTFRARDRSRDDLVVKLAGASGTDPDGVELLRLEHASLERLTHPNLARVLACGTEPSGLSWVASEHVEGSSAQWGTSSIAVSTRSS